jgi:hypothetical protein
MAAETNLYTILYLYILLLKIFLGFIFFFFFPLYKLTSLPMIINIFIIKKYDSYIIADTVSHCY